jgi:cytochrome c oxidase accessory protein FixG
MFDRDTLIVTYDAERGEPRGGRSRIADINKLALGSCVDCSLCVQVCPTGIDIRNGLQYECIGCGACADVCDTVMDKMGYARGLVKFSTQNAVALHWSRQEMWKRVLRPRVLIYASVLAIICISMLLSLSFRTPFKVDVVRDRGVMSRIVEGDKIENVYRLQIMNATEHKQHYKISADGLQGLEIEYDGDESDGLVTIEAAQSKWVTMHLQVPEETAVPGSHTIQFVVQALDTPDHVHEKSVFLVPR